MSIIAGTDENDTINGSNAKDTIYGYKGDDEIYGGKGDDSIEGNEGNDKLYGEGGHDTIYGGEGNDIIDGGDDNDFLYGDNGNDIIIGGSGNDYIDGGNGDDEISGGDGSDTIYGGAGNDTIYGDKSDDLIYGNSGNDLIYGGLGNDTIDGGDENDLIFGDGGNDSLDGGSGDDTIWGGIGNDTITGGTGHNRIEYAKGDGHDTIKLTKNEILDINLTKFDETDNITCQRSGNDLAISVNGEEIITIKDFPIKDVTGKNGAVNLYQNEKLIANLKKLNIFSTEYSSFTVENKNYEGNLKAEKITAVSLNKKKIENGAYINAYDGNDTITGSKYNDTILGGDGDDIIKAGNGDDILNGGFGDDKLYGEGGNNTYIFDSHAQGNDTIYTSGNGKTVIDFSDTDLIFSENSVNNAVEKYIYSKSKNDLIINYATTDEEDGNSSITISNYFKSKNEFVIKNFDGSEFNIKNAIIYTQGEEERKNKITGTKYDDYILGGNLNDVLKGGDGNDIIYGNAGNDKIYGGNGDDIIYGGDGNDIIYGDKGDDVIYGGQGDDTITGGVGYNQIIYTKGDGFDTINLTKNENLDIKLKGFDNGEELTYKMVKNDYIISYIENNVETEILKLKNFGKKDITTAGGSVRLYNGKVLVNNLRENSHIIYNDFTAKKNTCTGTWLPEVFNASSLNGESVKNNKGVKINAGDGHDVIYGSDYNDTLNGGNGNDTISGNGGNDVIYGGNGDDEIYTDGGKNTVYGGNGDDIIYCINGDDKIFGGNGNDVIYTRSGNNTIDGGNGNDTYYIFELSGENTIIKDTGKGDVDTVVIDNKKEDCKIWFNIDKKGKVTKTFNVNGLYGNSATITGVEKIVANGGTVNDTNDDYYYDYTNEKLKNDVVSWLSENGYANVNSVMNGTSEQDQNALFAIFEQGWTQK